MTTKTNKFFTANKTNSNALMRRPEGSVIHETFDSNGLLATQIIRPYNNFVSNPSPWLIQYDSSGHIVFKERLDNFNQRDITYNNGRIASVRSHKGENDIITQYDDKCNIISQITVKKDDVVTFQDGYLQSVTKYRGNTLQEIEFGDKGRKLSSTQKVRTWIRDKEFWMTTEAKQYHTNGKLQSVVTYEQRTAWTSNFTVTTDNGFSNNLYDEQKAVSYISSIAQYDENGVLVITAQLKEYDEVNFNGNKVASIVKRQPNGDTISHTTYYPNGQICSIAIYFDNKIVSYVTYDEQGKPTSDSQQERAIPTTKALMSPQQAANILGISINASEQEINRAYRDLCKKWHPDRNPGNEETAKRKMQQINEARSVMLKYVRARSQQSRPQPGPQRPQPGPQRPPYETQEQVAWKKLQKAIRLLDEAKEQLKQATENKNRIIAELNKTYKLEKRRVLLAQLQKAHALWSKCATKKLTAESYVRKCEQEYKLSRMMKSYTCSQQHTYQRAA